MSNNKNIALHGEATRWKPGESGKAQSDGGKRSGEVRRARASVRAQLRLWVGREFDLERMVSDEGDKYAMELLTDGGRRKPTGAEMLAFKMLTHALRNPAFIESVMQQVDGKLVERSAEVKSKSLAELIEMSMKLEQGGGIEVEEDEGGEG